MRRTLKFGVNIIESGLFLENIMVLKGLMKDDGVVASEGITSFPVDKLMQWKLFFVVDLKVHYADLKIC